MKNTGNASIKMRVLSALISMAMTMTVIPVSALAEDTANIGEAAVSNNQEVATEDTSSEVSSSEVSSSEVSSSEASSSEASSSEASSSEASSSEASSSDTSSSKDEQTTCICTAVCTEATKNMECPVCKEDATKCAFKAADVSTSGEITAFKELTAEQFGGIELTEQQFLTVAQGSFKQPETLTATVAGKEVQVPVTWEIDSFSASEQIVDKGLYILTPTFPSHHLQEDVEVGKLYLNLLGRGRSTGNGTALSPLLLSSEKDLRNLSDLVNADLLNKALSLSSTEQVVINLTEDISLGDGVWVPIGHNAGSAFTGLFDGNNYTISDFKTESGSVEVTGLFGHVNGATISNLTILNGEAAKAPISGILAGSVVNSKITNCHVIGGRAVGDEAAGFIAMVSSSTLQYCSVTGGTSVTGLALGGNIAGLAAYAVGSTISSCFVQTGEILVEENAIRAGGLVGMAISTKITNCYANADVWGALGGGLVAEAGGTTSIESCVSYSPTVGTDTSGGLVGKASSGSSIKNSTVLAPAIYATASMQRIVASTDTPMATLIGNWAYEAMLGGGNVGDWNDDPNGVDGKHTAASDLTPYFGDRLPTAAWIDTTSDTTRNVLPILKGPSGGAMANQNNQKPLFLTKAESGHYFAGGDGTAQTPYLIANEAQFNNFRELLTQGSPYDQTGMYYKLSADIALSQAASNADAPDFKGDFDGDGCTISNLRGSLFDTVSGSNAKVHDLNLGSVDLDSEGRVGAVANTLDGLATVSNCSVTGSISGSGATSVDLCLGGVVGVVSDAAKVENCFSNVYITSDVNAQQSANLHVGGIVGFVDSGSIVKDSYAIGQMIHSSSRVDAALGGVVGTVDSGTVESCYSITSIEGNDATTGGVAGHVAAGGTVKLCASFAKQLTGGADETGRIVGTLGGALENNGAFENMLVNDAVVSSGDIGLTAKHGESLANTRILGTVPTTDSSDTPRFTDASWNGATAGTMPILKSATVRQQHSVRPAYMKNLLNAFESGDGTALSPYVITSEAHLRTMARLVNDPAPANETYRTAYYEIQAVGTQSIVLKEQWTPIGRYTDENSNYAFKGHFNGNNIPINGLDCEADDSAGLFGDAVGATIKNVVLNNVNVVATHAGALVGYAEETTVSNCYSSGKVANGGANGNAVGGLIGFGKGLDVTSSGSTAAVHGAELAGGLIGSISDSTVKQCYATGSVNNLDEGQSSNNMGIGGLVGYAHDDITIKDSYATGTVMGYGNAGSLVGDITDRVMVDHCYASGSVTSAASGAVNAKTASAGGLVGAVYGVNTISNSVAIGVKVGVKSGTTAGRIAGYVDQGVALTLANNVAHEGLLVNGVLVASTDAQATATGKHGLPKAKAQISPKSFWTGMGFAESAWKIADNNRPIVWQEGVSNTPVKGQAGKTDDAILNADEKIVIPTPPTGGGSSGGGGGGGYLNIGSRAPAPTQRVITAPVGKNGATKPIATEIKRALEAGLTATTTRVYFTNYDALLPDGVKTMVTELKTALGSSKMDVAVRVNFDMVANKKVTARITAELSALQKAITAKTPLRVWNNITQTNVKTFNTSFAKRFSNKHVSVVFEQKKPLNMNVEVAMRLDLSKLNAQTLQFYCFDQATGTYTLVEKPNYFLDKNGFVHFTVPFGGAAVITDAPLAAK